MAYDHVTTLCRHSGSSIGCRLLNKSSTNCACLSTSRSSIKRQCIEKPPDCRRRCSIKVSASRCYEGELCYTEDSPQAREEGVFRCCSTSVESSSNRPQNVAFYSCIQALFEYFFVLDGIQCLISRPLHTAFTLKLFRFYRF